MYNYKNLIIGVSKKHSRDLQQIIIMYNHWAFWYASMIINAIWINWLDKEKLEDTKAPKGYLQEAVIRRRTESTIVKRKMTNDDLQELHRKQKIEKHKPYCNKGMHTGTPEG